MVRRILSFINKEIGNLHEAAYLLAVFALLSQLLALVRDRVFAHMYGASIQTDLYYAAFRIPDVLFITIASLVSISILVPFLIEKSAKGKEQLKQFINAIFSFFFLLMVVVASASYLLMPKLLALFFPQLMAGDMGDELLNMSRLLLLSPILLGFSNFLASITQMANRFFVYALSPVLYNVGIIFGLLFLAPKFGILGVVYGVVCGALLHMAIQVPFVIHAGLLPVPTTKLLLRDIFRVTHISLWRALTLSSHEIARLILIAIAGSMVVGSISVFTFALNLQSVPLSIIAVSYSLAAFPMLTKDIVNGNKENFVKNMISGCRYIIFLSMPVMVIFVVLRAQIVRTILGSGEFTWADTKLTAACLALFAFSIIPQSLVILFTRAYYAKGNTQIPLYINAISGVVMIVLGYALIAWHNAHVTVQYFFESLFKVEDVVGSGVLMLALAYSLALWIAFLAYWFVFAREYKTFAQPVLHTTFQSFAASILLGFITYKYLGVFDNVFDINTFWGIFLQGLCAGIIGLAFGLASLKILKNKEIDEMWRALHKKFWRASVVAPDAKAD